MTFLFMRRRSEKEKEENTWRRKISFVGRRKTEKEKEGMSIWRSIFFVEEKKSRKGKGGKYLEKEHIFLGEWWLDAHCTITCTSNQGSIRGPCMDQKILSVPRSRKKLLTKSQCALGLISISYLRKHRQTGSTTNDFPKSHIPHFSTFFSTFFFSLKRKLSPPAFNI